MSIQHPQVKKGYIRGVKGLVVTMLTVTGAPVAPAVTYGIKTAQQVGVSVVEESGDSAILRGGDMILARIKEPNTVVGLELTLQNARFDAEAIKLIAGGTLIVVVEGADTRVNGWESPTIEQQQTPPYFKGEAYAVNHSASGAADGWVKYTFAFCRATFGNETLQDQTWAIPEMKIEVQESPLGGGAYRKEFVDTLPGELI
ncbi:MAG: hypothetical protein ACLKAK_07310 [Alkaliphilus sp.]